MKFTFSRSVSFSFVIRIFICRNFPPFSMISKIEHLCVLIAAMLIWNCPTDKLLPCTKTRGCSGPFPTILRRTLRGYGLRDERQWLRDLRSIVFKQFGSFQWRRGFSLLVKWRNNDQKFVDKKSVELKWSACVVICLWMPDLQLILLQKVLLLKLTLHNSPYHVKYPPANSTWS